MKKQTGLKNSGGSQKLSSQKKGPAKAGQVGGRGRFSTKAKKK